MNRSLVIFIFLLFVTVTVAPANAAPDDDPVQRAALMALYNSTNGPNWNNNDGWGSQTTYCTWYGVDCNELGDVIFLTLGYNNLISRIPPELADLTELRRLFLDWNRLSGAIPPELGTLSNLAILSARVNNLNGPIPPDLGNLASLRHLLLDINDLDGSIPSALGDLSNLKELDLSRNELSGHIPPELGNLDNVRKLNLEKNDLSGLIPRNLGSMTNITSLYLGYNKLIEPIPHELSNLDNLKILNLEWNLNLTCWETPSAADWASDLLNYRGPTWACGPDDPVQRNALMALYGSTNGPNWSYNYWWGSTRSYCMWSGIHCSGDRSVIYLVLMSNNLSGTIPPEIGDLSNLRVLDIPSNNLSGAIPSELGNLSHLSKLFLMDNNLAGPIPASLSSLEELYWLDLIYNPKLTCWENFAALAWAWSLPVYLGPDAVCGVEITDSYLPYLSSPN